MFFKIYDLKLSLIHFKMIGFINISLFSKNKHILQMSFKVKKFFNCEYRLKIFPSKIFGIHTLKNRRDFISNIHLIVSILIFTTLPKKNSASEIQRSTVRSFVTRTGLKIIDFRKGDGDSPVWGDILKVNFVIYLFENGVLEKIDSTYDRKENFLFRHGNGQMADGFEEAIHSMNIGGKRRIVLSKNDLYTRFGFGPIIPSSNRREKIFNKKEIKKTKNNNFIIFDIELLDIKSKLTGIISNKTDFGAKWQINKILERL